MSTAMNKINKLGLSSILNLGEIRIKPKQYIPIIDAQFTNAKIKEKQITRKCMTDSSN